MLEDTASISPKKISQTEFYSLYLRHIDQSEYRSINPLQKPEFRLAKLLADEGYSPDLSYLNLRNLDFTGADFTSITLEQADFGGSILHHADFRGAANIEFLFDENTLWNESKLTVAQQEELGLKINEDHGSAGLSIVSNI